MGPNLPALPDDHGAGFVGNGGTIRALLLENLSATGALASQLSNVEAQATLIIAEHQRAAESRARLHEKLSTAILDVALLKQEVDRIRPLVDLHERNLQRDIGDRAGSMRMGKMAYGLMAAIAGFVAFMLDLAVRYLTTTGRGH